MRDRLGEAGVDELLRAAGEDRRREVLLDDRSWSTYDQFKALLQEAARLLDDVGGLAAIGQIDHSARSTMPEFARAMHDFGSPLSILMAAGEVGAAIYPVLPTRPEALGPTHVRSTRSFHSGFEPFPELCQFLRALSHQAVLLFGMRIVDSRHISCQCNGDEECIDEVRWDETEDLGMQLAASRNRLEITERRLEAFQTTVGEIVTTDDLDATLARIVASAARAVVAPGFILVVDVIEGGSRIYAEGMDVETARETLTAETAYLSVEVSSIRRRYGRLIVVAPPDSVSFEVASLEAYARLAATALDSAFALEEARRQARSAEAMLELSTSLAELSSVEELAAKVARAIPNVIDCDCAMVLYVSAGVARIAAHHGYRPEIAARLKDLEIPADAIEGDHVVVTTAGEAPRVVRELMDAAGVAAAASAPLNVDETMVGLLVAAVRHDTARIIDDTRLADRFAVLAGQATVALRNGRLLEQIRHRSLYDSLTDLPNRALILDRAEQMLARTRRNGASGAALFLDLDGFKEVNDTLGHGAGDELLQKVSSRLKAAVRPSDTVGRLGGDEFVVLCDGASLQAGVEVLAERLLAALREPFQLTIRERPISVGVSIGIALGERASAEELLRDADIALYRAKAAGKGCYRIFAPEMQHELMARAQLAERLADALEHGDFYLLYQPIIDAMTDVTVGFEALIRMRGPRGTVVEPAAFIPVAEETGLINPIGRWVLEEACRHVADCNRTHGRRLAASVNISAHQVQSATLYADVVRALEMSGLDPSLLILEVTETVIMHDIALAQTALTQLKSLGVRIALDDFGTGYTSLSYVQSLPLDILKIDRSFTTALEEGCEPLRRLAEVVVSIGQAIGLETIAEGVETVGQADRLRRLDCRLAQGFLYGRPMPGAEIGNWMVRTNEPGAGSGREPTSPISVLVVDDDRVFRTVVAELIERELNCDVHQAGDGHEAVRMARNQQPDLVLLDLAMPRMGGLDVLPTIRTVSPNSRVIIVSALEDTTVTAAAVLDGAVGCFDKGRDLASLMEHVDAALLATGV